MGTHFQGTADQQRALNVYIKLSRAADARRQLGLGELSFLANFADLGSDELHLTDFVNESHETSPLLGLVRAESPSRCQKWEGMESGTESERWPCDRLALTDR